MKLKTILVEDEARSREILRNYIAKYCPNIELVGEASGIDVGLDLIKNNELDLVFLDVEMPYGNAFDLLDKVENRTFETIFVTAYDHYAVEALNNQASYYLLKPISFGRFMKAINKIQRKPAVATIVTPESIPVSSNTVPFLYIKMDKKILKVYLDKISYIESQKDYVRIVLEDDNDVVTKQKISYLEQRLPSGQFLRIHRSYIVAVNKITAFSSINIEIDKIELPIGRSYKQFVMEALNF